MKVLKFGGSSVGSPDAIRKTSELVAAREDARAVVFSAYQGVTDKLIKTASYACARDARYREEFDALRERHRTTLFELIEGDSAFFNPAIERTEQLLHELEEVLHGIYLIKELSPKSLDYIQSYGERLSCSAVAGYFCSVGIDCEFLDARDIIKTTREFSSAAVLAGETNAAIQNYFGAHKQLQIVTGFIGSTADNETTTLGRGGSDYTASILGAALEADAIEIWTDVDGVLTADPRAVPDAFVVSALSYEEAMELSYFGAKVIYAPTIQPAFEKRIPIHILNTFNSSHPGSVIAEYKSGSPYGITGIASINDVAVLRVEGSGMVGITGVVSRLFKCLAERKINIILITQASSEHTICFAIESKNAAEAKALIEKEFDLEISAHRIAGIQTDYDLAIVSVVGEQMRHRPGVSGKIFGILGKHRINIAAIAQGSSELNVSFAIAKTELTKALQVIHTEFFHYYKKSAHLFLAGTGNVGGCLLKMLKNFEDGDTVLAVAGIMNSKKMLFSRDGLPLDTDLNRHPLAEPAKADGFLAFAESHNHPVKIFVDCTADAVLSARYADFLRTGIHVVAANKIANSSGIESYMQTRAAAKDANVKFKYETNVGAALPVIKTLQHFVRTRDTVHKIEALLSGSVNFILTRVHEGKLFAEAVEEAKQLGYTEPNPNIDLSGLDVARKILILTRELGKTYELRDVAISSLIEGNPLDADLNNCTLLDIDALSAEAKAQGKKLRLVAGYENDEIFVRLTAVDSTNPLYLVDGANSAVRFFTSLYDTYPLVISGQGAGGELTASGVLDDILSIVN